jgi:Ser/Thr protein kinase RdoA (MazF antagonist)
MALLQQAPALTAAEASDVARELYGIDAAATPLPSERDQNFRVDVKGRDKLGPYVLKIANASDDRALLEAQIAAAAHLHAHGVTSFNVMAAKSGEQVAALPARFGGRHLVRMVTWLPGLTMADLPQRSPALLESLGRYLGEMDRALATFDHPALHRDFYWDLANGLSVVRERLALVQDASLKRVIANAASRMERDELKFRKLRRSIIHNDANDHNIVVSEDGQRVVGVIDLGDMVRSFTVADLAIAIAYAVLDRPNPLETAGAIVRGYTSAYPLLAEELDALGDLVILRLCVSACVAADQQRQRPGDQYLTISQASIARTLPKLENEKHL